MKKYMNLLVVSRREEQGTAIKQMKAAQLVVVFGMGLILMSLLHLPALHRRGKKLLLSSTL